MNDSIRLLPSTGLRLASLALALVASVSRAALVNASYTQPTLDKWVYPFASNGGGLRTSAPTFGSVGGDAGLWDDRDAQFLAGFNTSGDVPTGLGAASYQVVSAQFTITMNIHAANLVMFDGSYDPISTYDTANGGAPINGDDAGRSIELYGVGYRNGFTATSMVENSPFAFGDPTLEGVRNFYATDFLAGAARDVSNNVRDGFDPLPFAVGQVAPGFLNLDGTIMDQADIVFTLNLANPDVLAYLASGLDLGRVNLMVSSMHSASQGGPATRPEFDTKELGLAGTPARLDLQVNVVPEPATAALLAAGAGILLRRFRRRRS